MSSWLISERVVNAAILLNTAALIALGFAGEDTLRELDTVWGLAAWWVDYVCILYFVVEAWLKVRAQGWSTYWSSGWNRFDFVVVLVSAPALVAPLVPGAGAWGKLVALRTGRLLRLIRVLRILPDADRLLAGIGRAMRASVGVFATLLIINLVLALLGASLFGALDSPTARAAFDDPLTAFYTIFKVFTVEGWYDLPEAIASETADPLYATLVRGYFIATVIIGGILGLSLANAVFIDEMVADNNDELEQRVAELTAALETHEHAAARERHELMGRIEAVVERLERQGRP